MRDEVFFETIKCEDYEVFNLEYHQKRVAKTIGLNINLQDYIYPISDELLRCKLVYDKNEVLDVQYFPYSKREIKSFKIILHDNIDYSSKYLNRENLDSLFTQKEDSDEIIIVKNGVVTDTTIANIAIFYDGVWITSTKPLLNGTTRERLLNDRVIFEKDISLDMLKNSSKIALMNAMIGFDILENYKLSL